MARLSKVILVVALAVALYATVMQGLLWRERQKAREPHWTITAKTYSTGFLPGLQVGPWGPQRVTREYDSVGLRVGPTLGVMTPAYAHVLAAALNKMADEVEADKREGRGR